jgi:hypothetical protein
MQPGIAGYEAGRYTRRVMKINAQNVQNEGVAQRDQIRFASRIAMGRQLIGQADSGFAVGTGSPLDELRTSATARELDIMTSRTAAQSKANAYKQEGDLAYGKGYSEGVGGIISGATTLMDEIAQAFGGGGGGAAAGGAGGAGGGT